jgi:hypothetical protein
MSRILEEHPPSSVASLSYLVEVPAIQGCWCVIKSNRTIGKALEDMRDVVEVAISARKKQR